jgi:hypothetical protein
MHTKIYSSHQQILAPTLYANIPFFVVKVHIRWKVQSGENFASNVVETCIRCCSTPDDSTSGTFVDTSHPIDLRQTSLWHADVNTVLPIQIRILKRTLRYHFYDIDRTDNHRSCFSCTTDIFLKLAIWCAAISRDSLRLRRPERTLNSKRDTGGRP